MAEEEDSPEYPAELDEFLEYCVQEHGDDWEAISQDFLDIASELEGPLVDRAQDFFSAAALRQRWLALSGDAPADGGPPPLAASTAAASAGGGAVGGAVAAVAAVAAAEAEPAAAAAPAASRAKPGVSVADVVEAAPSDFSIFRDSLKDQIEQIYQDVQNRLPSALDVGEGSDEGNDSDTNPPTPDLCSRALAAAAAIASSGNAAASAGEDATADLAPAGLAGGDLERRALELFGTADLGTIFAEAEGLPSTDEDGTQPGPTKPDMPFAAAARSAPAYGARSTRAAAKAAAFAAVEVDETSNGSGKGSGESSDEDFNVMRNKLKSSSKVIVTTKEAAGVAPASDSKPPPRKPQTFAPPPRAKAADSASQPPSSGSAAPTKQFVKLQLVETSGEDTDSIEAEASASQDGEEEASEGGEEDGGRDVMQDAEVEPIRVMTRLLHRAPTGECAWDVWLDATRRYPRMQVVLGSPEFFRRGNHDLRVAFDADKLRKLLEVEKANRVERLRLIRERKERCRNGLSDFVKEAERRREMMGSRFGGGFVLNSRNPKLEERLDESRRHKRAAEEEEEKRKAEVERLRREAREQREHREDDQRRKKADEKECREKAADAARAQARQETEAKLREERLAVLRSEVARHRCPLYNTHLSHGPSVRSISFHAERILNKSTEDELCAYAIPWGTPQGGSHAASMAQREALGFLYDSGVAEAMMLLRVFELGAAAPSGLSDHGECLVLLLLLGSDSAARTFDERLPCGSSIRELVAGSVPVSDAVAVLRRPLALWAGQRGAREREDDVADVETVCVALCRRGGVQEGAVRALLTESQVEGLALAGARLIFPAPSPGCGGPGGAPAASAALRGALRVGGPALALALRGPRALVLWRSLLGPADPPLARRTDPASLNARFGGASRDEAVAVTPPSTNGKALADVVWAFGGRVEGKEGTNALVLPSNPVHALIIESPQYYGLRLSGPLAFSSAGETFGGLLMRAGRILSLCANAHGEIVMSGLREGGGAFAEECGRLLCSPNDEEDVWRPGGSLSPSGSPSTSPNASPNGGKGMGTALTGVSAAVCKPASRSNALRIMIAAPTPSDGIEPSKKTTAAACIPIEELQRLGEPEVLVVGIRPRPDAPMTVQRVLDGLFAKFGVIGGDPAGLSVGMSADLLALRAIDFASASAKGSSMEAASEYAAASEVLRDFRAFPHLVKRAADEPCEGWWLPREDSTGLGPHYPAVLLCLRGEDLLNRFKTFLSREWTLQAATAGDVYFAASARVSWRAWNIFFGGLPSTSVFQPSCSAHDLRSGLRFRGHAVALTQTELFPSQSNPQVTFAVLLPPSVDTLLFRTLTAAERNGFTVLAAVLSGGTPERTAQLVFDQEVADGHLRSADWEEFRKSFGSTEDAQDQDDNHFRCVWLVLSRHQGVKRLAQLCGHSDPAVNERHCRACLRLGRSPIQNGIRCATSRASADAVLETLEANLAPWLCPPSGEQPGLGRCLGVEASGVRVSECAAVVVVGTCPAAASHLRELHAGLQEQGLTLIGLRLLPWRCQAGVASCSGEWPRAQAAALESQWHQWVAARPAAAALARRLGAAASGAGYADSFLLVVACEGPQALGRARAAAAAAAGKAQAGDVEWYAATSADEASVDVSHFFHELFGGHHYIVQP